MELEDMNKILIYDITNSWDKKSYIQVFYFESEIHHDTIDIFEKIQTEKHIHEVIVKPLKK